MDFLLWTSLFIGVNLDFFLILLVFLQRYTFRQVWLGYALGMLIIWLVGAVISLVLQIVVPLWVLGGLGILPIIYGLRGESDDERDIQTQRGWLMVLFVYLAGCGADNLAVYIPVLATMTIGQMLLAGSYFMLLTWGSLVVAQRVGHLPMIAQTMTKWGEPLTRVIYILIGLYVIWESHFIPEMIQLLT